MQHAFAQRREAGASDGGGTQGTGAACRAGVGIRVIRRLADRLINGLTGSVFLGDGDLECRAARAGAEVTIIQRGPRMLTQFEPELVSWLMDAFDRIGVRVITYTAVDAIRKRGGEYVVHASGPIEVAADLVVHAAGRVPAIERLNVKKADVAVENRKLKLSEFCKA